MPVPLWSVWKRASLLPMYEMYQQYLLVEKKKTTAVFFHDESKKENTITTANTATTATTANTAITVNTTTTVNTATTATATTANSVNSVNSVKTGAAAFSSVSNHRLGRFVKETFDSGRYYRTTVAKEKERKVQTTNHELLPNNYY
jgi:hypothetical protein